MKKSSSETASKATRGRGKSASATTAPTTQARGRRGGAIGGPANGGGEQATTQQQDIAQYSKARIAMLNKQIKAAKKVGTNLANYVEAHSAFQGQLEAELQQLEAA